ncbi:UDP-N-acetylmuramoyl-L-alanine--D-glutamate ligase [Lewinella sp. 4G2]|uniref:UDP-N-acetylmuramoyl-L-alanine--D-glutamate ligase n=1 Tax=Lewinella sp. 4G2 TaxID=1803372 RepID=UPI0007B4E6F7|nr:UDP-N-acetylmuramoyl-L-alanine--D-glutamate ligase [Lewinella sp. 4G2]OAV44780.1 UDP-N-acetylmuramoylalanine--D-glutamate ligase [Lewinella sp. 4G2]
MTSTKSIIILGAGESGASAARLAKAQGFEVFVSDYGRGVDRFVAELEEAGIAYELGGHSEERILAADEVIKSPGIPDTAPIIVALRKQGTPVISEIEFASRYAPRGCKIVGITGSNGKTTTTLLTHHLLAFAGVKTLAGGNLGDSFARLLLDFPPQDVYVLELSSFQLDGIVAFRPDIAAVLNITPDHLDRYEYELEKYANAKLRIAQSQRMDDRLFVLAEPTVLGAAVQRANPSSQLATIGAGDITEKTIKVEGYGFDLNAGQLRGKHNALNALFAVRIALALGVNEQEIQLALNSFTPAPHRMEVVATQDGRTWINDSKATNVDATYFALDAMDGPTVWIAGGTDKGNDYDVLTPLVEGKVHTLICMGKDNTKLLEVFTGAIPNILECHSAQAATVFAGHRANKGDRVLLSPCCASFDLFKNYIDRGDQFRAAVQKLYA